MNSKKKKYGILIFCELLFIVLCSLFAVSSAEIVDRIVATINDHVITLSELKERSRLRPEAQPEGIEKRDEKEVLEGIINMVLLLSEAKRLGLADPEEIGTDPYRDTNIMIERFIERRIKAFILIPMERSKDFYEVNKEKFRGKEFFDVRDEINHYLIEEETNKRIEKYLKELREKADVRILY